tara:strand:+ start:98 stop:301 length:204 start_codon:yes stop_codon:yes gene_type:complete
MKQDKEKAKMNHSTLKAILIELHRPHGLLEKKGWDVPLNFFEEVETADFETLNAFFEEIIQFLNAEF